AEKGAGGYGQAGGARGGWDWAELGNNTRAPSPPASGCGNRAPIATPAAPAAITTSTPPASATMLGAPMGPRSCTSAVAAAISSRLAGAAPTRLNKWARGRVPAVAGKLAYRSPMALRAARPAPRSPAARPA